ncbi:MAG TPA: tetratricopeptide repeat protein [Pirellulales bacterium]
MFRAQVFKATGDFLRALEDVHDAIRFSPGDPLPHVFRAELYVEQLQYPLAIAACNAALALDPASATAISCRAIARCYLGDAAQAFADAEEAARLDSTLEGPLQVRAAIYLDRGDLSNALQQLDEAIRLVPDSAASYCTRSLVYQALGDNERALADCDRAIALTPNDPVPWNNRGFIQMKRGEYAGAVGDYRRAIECGPKHPNAYKNLAWLLATCPEERFRNGTEATRQARRALELSDWKQAQWHEILAAAYAESGDYGAAARWQTKAIRMFGAAAPPEANQRLEAYQSCRAWRE